MRKYLPAEILQSLPDIVKNEILYPKLNEKTDEALASRAQTTARIVSMLDVNFKGQTDEEIKAEMNLATSEFSTFLKGYYLTGKEIIEAYRMALSGELKYKVYPNLSLIQCGEILALYQEFKSNSYLRDRGIKTLNELNRKSEKELTEKYLSQINDDFERKVFEEIRSTGFSHDADYFHAQLKEKNKLKNWNKEMRERFYKKVEAKYLIKTELQVQSGNVTRNFLSQLKRDAMKGNPRNEVLIICKKIMVCNYLKKHCESFEEFKNALHN